MMTFRGERLAKHRCHARRCGCWRKLPESKEKQALYEKKSRRLERIIEQSKESYSEALQTSSVGSHDGSHDIMPWFHYFLSTIHSAYREFEERAV
jgi:hypothetical protein